MKNQIECLDNNNKNNSNKKNRIVDKKPSDPSMKFVIFKRYIQIIDAKAI